MDGQHTNKSGVNSGGLIPSIPVTEPRAVRRKTGGHARPAAGKGRCPSFLRPKAGRKGEGLRGVISPINL